MPSLYIPNQHGENSSGKMLGGLRTGIGGIDVNYFRSMSNLRMLMESPQYLIWWQMSHHNTNIIKEYMYVWFIDCSDKLQKTHTPVCEVMVQLICKLSEPRCDDYRILNAPFTLKRCSLCDYFRNVCMYCLLTVN